MQSNTGKIQPTIDERISKGYGIVSEILALIDQVPLGKYSVMLRHPWNFSSLKQDQYQYATLSPLAG